MSTPISVSLEFTASPDQVFAMLSTESYLKAKCVPALSASHSVTHESDEVVISVTREMGLPANIPDIARSVVGNTLKLTEIQRWKDAQTETRNGKLNIVVVAGTAEITGTLSLKPHGSGSVLEVNADIMVRVPLFGASLERSIAGTVESVLHAEREIGQAWLDQNV